MTQTREKRQEKGFRKYLTLHFLKTKLKTFLPAYQKLFVFEQSLSDLPPLSKPISDIKIELKTKLDDITSLVEQRESWYGPLAKKRFEEGNVCFIAKSQEKIVCCLWTSFNEVYLPNVEYTLKVEDDVVPLIDGWTSPDFRGKGIYKHVWNECLRHFNSLEQYTRIYGFIQPTNTRSLVVHKKINLDHVIIIISLFKIFRVRFHRTKRLQL